MQRLKPACKMSYVGLFIEAGVGLAAGLSFLRLT
jgi:hypothetical protein